MEPFSLPEVIIASSNACHIYDDSNGNEIASYKDNSTFIPKTLSLIGEDYLIGAYANKPMLKVSTISKLKKQEVEKFVVPGIVSALAVSNCGHYCIAGINNQIYVWEVTSGEVKNILCYHYQQVTCLTFTEDDSRFFSGSDDGHVLVWVLSHVIDVYSQPDTTKPHFVWNDHSSQVTDIYCGTLMSYVATTSLDSTCKIYGLSSGKLLSTIFMDSPLTCVVMDSLEDIIFLGDDKGSLYRINTYERLPIEIHWAEVTNKEVFRLHRSKIISVCITWDGKRLMTASEDGTIRVLDWQNMVSMLNIRVEGVLTNAFIALQPAALSQEAVDPQFRVRTFQKDLLPISERRKYIEAKICHKKLSLMHDGCPDKYYSDSFCSIGTKVKAEEMGEADASEPLIPPINKRCLSDEISVNQQLFAYACSNVLGRP